MSLRGFQSTIFFALLFTFILIVPSVKAENGQTYQVGTSNLNIRTAPANDGQIIGQLGYGNKVVVFKESNGWGQTYYNGEEAWVALHYLYLGQERKQASQPQKATTAVDPTKVTITANSVRIRSGPSTAYNMIGSTGQGASFQFVESNGDWHKIALSNGKTGWIAGWLTSLSSDAPAQQKSNSVKTTPIAVPAKTNSNQSLAGYNIVLDPGHGGKDPGAIALDGSYEKNLILSTAHVIAQRLRDAGATVIMTRENDRFLHLADRVGISRAYYTHAFISLHFDAFPIQSVNGFSTHYYSSFGKDRQLAQSIQNGIAQHVNLRSRGLMQSDLHVLRENIDSAVLVELGFLTNPYDLANIQTADYQQGVADGITSGLINYFK